MGTIIQVHDDTDWLADIQDSPENIAQNFVAFILDAVRDQYRWLAQGLLN